MIVSVQSARFIVFNHSCRCFFVWQWQKKLQLEPISILAPNIATRWYFKLLVISALVWIGCLQFFALFCLQLALWRNCVVGPKRVYSPEVSCLALHRLRFLCIPSIFSQYYVCMVLGVRPKFFALLHCEMWFLTVILFYIFIIVYLFLHVFFFLF